MSTCNRLDLQTLGSQPVMMPKNFPDHCFPPHAVRGVLYKNWYFFYYLLQRGSDFFNFLFTLKLPKAGFVFARLNFGIHLWHLSIFLVYEFHFGMFLKLCIVSWILFLFLFFVSILFHKINWWYAYKWVNLC